MAYYRKRKVSVVSGRNVRGRRTSTGRVRFSRARRSRFSRRATTITGQSGVGKSFGYRSRRIRPRKWKRILWRDTLANSHYRSTFDITNSLAAPLATTAGAIPYLIQALPPVGFWTVGGGVQQLDVGVGPPAFTGDLVIRGGMIRLGLANESTVEAVRARVWLLKSNKNPDFSKVVVNPTLVSSMWDPSLSPDFDEFGRVVLMREMTLLPVSNPLEIFYRLPVQKIDQAEYLQTSPTIIGGSQYYWYVVVSRMTLVNNLVAPALRAVSSHSLSFSGDVNT